MIRLLELTSAGELRFKEFTSENDLPEYAILSHTWSPREEEELRYEEVVEGNMAKIRDNPGYAKVRFCAMRAQHDDIRFFWVDTCCINKSHSAELNEAIISMFRWYQNAAKCYAYLSDVSFDIPGERAQELRVAWEPALRRSRWFTRGWTLQELIAPKFVQFFSREGLLLGDKASLVQLVHETTQISVPALCGAPLSSFTIEERMSWTSSRQTGRPEDIAYCLLGIFNVTVIPAYGEGRDRAFGRLKHEIRNSESHGDPALQRQPQREILASDELPVAKRRKFEDDQTYDAGFYPALLDSLKFDQIETRRLTIKNAHAKTCRWFLKGHEYLKWMNHAAADDCGGFLWIRGKPGSGKSTLMKFIYNTMNRKVEGHFLLSFFFNARGQDLERSVAGTYRTLLVQLLETRPSLIRVVCRTLGSQISNVGPDYHWRNDLLKELLKDVIQSIDSPSATVLIDALDEGDEDEIRDMISFLDEICDESALQSRNLRICLASRHYPHITLKKGSSLILEDQLEHNQDILRYLASELRMSNDEFEEEIRTEIVRKASGVFMWVVLVVRILNKEYDRGNTDAIRQRLAEIPADIYQLFRDILQRDSHNKVALALCTQWLLFARQPLRREQLYDAIKTGLGSFRQHGRQVTQEEMDRFILNSSKGLTEVTKSKTPTVQFIHESVRDFFLKKNGLVEILSESAANIKGQSHDRLKRCCHSYVSSFIQVKANGVSGESLSKVSSLPKNNERPPLLEYAVENVLYHADKAAEHGIVQKHFLQTFDLTRWAFLANSYRAGVRGYNALTVSLVYIFGERSLPNLIKQYGSPLFYLGKEEKERYKTPLFAALAIGTIDTACAFLNAHVTPSDDHVSELLSRFAKDPRWRGEFNRKSAFLEKAKTNSIQAILFENASETLLEFLVEVSPQLISSNALHTACEREHLRLMQALIKNGMNVNSKTLNGNSLIYDAVPNQAFRVVELLLQNGADIKAEEKTCGTSLHQACFLGDESLVELLLDAGARFHCRDECFSALEQVCSFGYLGLVRLLLDRGKEPKSLDAYGGPELIATDSSCQFNVTEILLGAGQGVNNEDRPGASALFLACSRGYTKIVNLLLRRGGNATVHDASGKSMLHVACYQGHKEMVQLLLDNGADVNHIDWGLESPLQIACNQGNKEIIKSLLDSGADVNHNTSLLGPALHIACRLGDKEMAGMILHSGADVNIRDLEEVSALHLACYKDKDEVAELLLDRGANIDCQQKNGFGSPLTAACKFGSVRVARLLLSRGADFEALIDALPSTSLSSTVTALRVAVDYDRHSIVKMLLERGANINDKSSSDSSLLQTACWHNQTEVARVLLDHGADVNAWGTSDKTDTPLRIASKLENEQMMGLLIDRGADVNAVDSHGYTALQHAIEKGHGRTARFLRDRGAKEQLVPMQSSQIRL